MSTAESVTIQPIDKTTVNQICSGQVVLNLATAVKELLENSIDAGANSVQVKLEEYGSDSIEVIDNGCGVEEVNFQALTLKHHTSKIREFSDLFSVETFGFRGEALSSLCSLSDVTIITQHKNADIGTTLKFDHNGLIISNSKTLRKTGTTVKLENLFCTLPIRRTEFLKNLKREFLKMCNVLYAYGLQSKGVRITCMNHVLKQKHTSKESQGENKRSTITTIMDTKGDSLESNIVSIFGLKQKQNLLKITERTPSEETLNEYNLNKKVLDLQKFQLDGFISSCAHGCGRSSSDRQFYFINSRPVDNQKITKLVNDIYHQYNNRQDPFVVLNIKVATGSFDMNVTPDKRQILLQNEKLLFAVIKESLNALFQDIPSTLEMQNTELCASLPKTEKMGLQERLEKFKAKFNPNSKNLLDTVKKKEATQSRIDSLLKFQLTSRAKSSLPRTSSDDCTPTESPSQCEEQENELTLDTTLEDNLLTNPQVINIEQTCVSEKPTITIHIEKTLEELSAEEKGNNETVENSCETQKPSSQTREIKRKFLERIQEVSDSDESDLKRMKYDEGLAEENKNSRKNILYNTTLSDIKKSFLSTKENSRAKISDSEVKFLAEIKPQSNERAETELKKELKKESFVNMEIIGQFNLGFIITKLGNDVFIIDQHASDEKYNFETLQATTVMQTQKLFNPEKLELTVDKEELMVQHENVFKKNGFDFVFDEDAPSTRRISLTSIPMSKNYVFGKDDVEEMLFLLEDAPEVTNIRPTRVNSMFASRACRKSVMIGTPLSRQEMRKIVDHMGEMQQPWNCPHGRPTMRHLVNLQMFELKE